MQLDSRFIKVAHDPGDPVLCSHCPFCGSGQITGRSDGSIECAFCGQVFIVRVQPAFPGMPQAPGMGAPTDIGPDMGAMPPEMGGEMPPGMEDEGMPPGEEDEGAPPFGDEEEAEGEAPGDQEEEGEEGEEGEGEGPPPPPRGKKKSARLYRTVTGDLLDEDRYIRHLAILHSGRSPVVIRLIRQAANGSVNHKAYLTTGDTPEHRANYDRGYSASEGYGGYHGDSSPLEEADLRGEPDSWYQGYMDHATDRPYGHAIECPAHDHDGPGCTLWDDPEHHDPAFTRQRDTAWLSQHGIEARRRTPR